MKIWLQSAQWFLRRCLKSADDGWTATDGQTTEAYLSYKLTNEPLARSAKNKQEMCPKYMDAPASCLE